MNEAMTAAVIKANQEAYKIVTAHNKEVKLLAKQCYKVFIDRPTSEMAVEFERFNHVPVVCWQYLEYKYSDGNMGAIAKGDRYLISSEARWRVQKSLIYF